MQAIAKNGRSAKPYEKIREEAMHRERVFILIRFSGHAPRAHKKICSLPNFIFPVGGDFINAQKKEADKASSNH